MRQIDFLGKRRIAFVVSAVLLLGSITTIASIGLNYGIDFVGGTELVVKTRPGIEIAEIRRVVEDLRVGDTLIQRFGDEGQNEYLIRIEGYAEEAEELTKLRSPVEAAGWQEESTPDDTAVREEPETVQGEGGGDPVLEMEDALTTAEAPAAAPSQESSTAQEPGMSVGERIIDALRSTLDDQRREGAFDLNALEVGGLAIHLEELVGGEGEALEVARRIVRYRREQADGILTDWSQLDEIEGLSPEVRPFLEENGYLGGFVQLKAEVVGPTIGEELRTKALLAIFWSLAGILAYVWFRFELRFSVASIVALVHDVIIVVGVLVLLGEEFSLPMIAALLTIVGYSLNDTIVVFDRVRENLRSHRGETEESVINTSVNQTLSRTLLTSGTTLVVVLCLLVLGGPVIHGFAVALFLGVLVGTYSSIYVASPVVLYWRHLQPAKK